MGAIAAIVLIAPGASAGDLRMPPPAPCGPPPCGPPPPPPYWIWAGPYVGANLGFQSGTLSNSGARPSGVEAGIQGGYNWQFGQFVAGWESDLQLSTANDVFANYKFSNPWFGTIRGHVGWTAGAGVEMGLLPNWSVKAEYLFIDLASETYGLTLTDNGLTSNLIRF